MAWSPSWKGKTKQIVPILTFELSGDQSASKVNAPGRYGTVQEFRLSP